MIVKREKLLTMLTITIFILTVGLILINKSALAQDSNTKLLLHMDGANNSTSFTDSSDNAHSVTAYGNAKMSTSAKKFGTASAYFDGSGDYLAVPDSSDFDFGSGNFTIDTWVYFNSVASSSGIAAQFNYAGTRGWNLYLSISTTNRLVFLYSTDGSTNANAFQSSWKPSAGQWYHIAIIRNGADYKAFVDGTQIGSTENMSTDTIYNYGSDFMIGAAIQGGSIVDQLNGYLDELRITKGIARWTSNFMPPTEPYGSSSSSSSGDGHSLDASDGTPANAVYVDKSGNVGIGTISPGTYKLAVNGKIKTKEVVMEATGWSDFVFEKHYNLMPLYKLEEYIEANRHLPQIPSAEEVAVEGIRVGDMQTRLLQKIEELTLYMIRQEKRAVKIEEENEEMRSENRLIKKRLEELENGKM